MLPSSCPALSAVLAMLSAVAALPVGHDLVLSFDTHLNVSLHSTVTTPGTWPVIADDTVLVYFPQTARRRVCHIAPSHPAVLPEIPLFRSMSSKRTATACSLRRAALSWCAGDEEEVCNFSLAFASITLEHTRSNRLLMLAACSLDSDDHGDIVSSNAHLSPSAAPSVPH